MIKVAIFGVGLIGGSLALCFKGKEGIHVTGYSNNPLSVEKYKKRNVVDEATTSIEEAAKDADFIFLCVPVGKLEEYLQRLSELPLKPGCIISDVGSTKSSIMRCAARLNLKDVYFIGGHPMAGSERSGVEAASSHLFENAFYVLTPLAETPDSVYGRLVKLLELTKAQVIRVDAEEHDRIVGAVSHLPHIIAAVLVNQIAVYNRSDDLYQQLAAGGFRDITRIASSDPVIWRDILINNRKVLLEQLRDWNGWIERMMRMLEQSDGPGIEQLFRDAKEFRNRLPERRKGVITSLYDVYVDVPDHPGVIGRITSEFGKHKVNLSNIQVIESREDVPGILRLSFRSEQELDKAVELLEKLSFSVHF